MTSKGSDQTAHMRRLYAQADLRLCWSHIPHCWKSHVTAQVFLNIGALRVTKKVLSKGLRTIHIRSLTKDNVMITITYNI